MDAVFRALGDIARRRLLDRLNEHNGLTLTALCADMGMTRQSVTRHLAVLEVADPVTTLPRGREKRGGVVKLTVVHDGFEPGSEVLQGSPGGWPAVTAGLKTLLENGSALSSVSPAGSRGPTAKVASGTAGLPGSSGVVGG